MEPTIEIIRKNGKRVAIPTREIRWVQEEDTGTFIELLEGSGFGTEEAYDDFVGRLATIRT
jgi:hypothetical protein